jgi:hypothetical protein
LLRDAAVRESHYNLTDLHGFEERIIAHLDGLSVAGDVAWPFCQAWIAAKGEGVQYSVCIVVLEILLIKPLRELANIVIRSHFRDTAK